MSCYPVTLCGLVDGHRHFFFFLGWRVYIWSTLCCRRSVLWSASVTNSLAAPIQMDMWPSCSVVWSVSVVFLEGFHWPPVLGGRNTTHVMDLFRTSLRYEYTKVSRQSDPKSINQLYSARSCLSCWRIPLPAWRTSIHPPYKFGNPAQFCVFTT